MPLAAGTVDGTWTFDQSNPKPDGSTLVAANGASNVVIQILLMRVIWETLDIGQECHPLHRQFSVLHNINRMIL